MLGVEDVVDLVVSGVPGEDVEGEVEVTPAVDRGEDQEVGLSQEGLMKHSDTYKGDRKA